MTTIPDELVPFERAKLEAETRKLTAEAIAAEAYQIRAQIAAEQAQFDQRVAHASDSWNHVYNFVGAVDKNSVFECQYALSRWHRMDPAKPIEIVFHSPGGSVFDGMALFDYIQHVRRGGVTINTSTRGMAASMGGILLQAGDYRTMGRESHILIHEIGSVVVGKLSAVKDEAAFMQRISDRVVDIFVERTGGKLSARTIKSKWKKTDWWISSDEALALNLVDEVV